MESHKNNEYNHTLESDKPYFAGFLNLAQNNIHAIFHLFCQSFGITHINIKKTEKQEDGTVNLKYEKKKIDFLKQNLRVSEYTYMIDEQFHDDTAISEYQKKVDFLKQYFPVIHYLEIINNKPNNKKSESNKREDFRKNFMTLVTAINDLRNFYTHYYHQPIKFNEEFFELLDKLLLTVILDVKKHRMKGEQTQYLVKENLQDEIDKLVKAKKKYLEEQKEKGKRVDSSDGAIKNGVFNDAFYHLLYKKTNLNDKYRSELILEKKEAKNNSNTAEDEKAKNNPNTPEEEKTEKKLNISVSESGLLFLLSMFLQKDENEQLRANIKGYKAKVIKKKENEISRNNNSLKFMATHWVFNHLSVKRIRHRLNTRFQKETLLLQIADELSKVPDEVYQTFTKEKKEEFIEDINEYLKDSNLSESLDKSTVIHPVIRKRYEDKFNYFALRFLDEFVEFPSLRFQIYLGNFVHDRREKSIAGTNYKTKRVIKEKINVFGRLSEISEIKSDFFISLKNKEESTQWEEFPNPSYNFVGNNIPIYLDPSKSKTLDKKQRGSLYKLNRRQKTNRKENKPTKTDIVNQLNKDIVFGQPTALLSLNEMPALLYEILKNNKTGEEIEDILFEKLSERINSIENFDPNTTPIIPTSKITKKLRISTDETKIDFCKLFRNIKNEIRTTEEKLSLIANNKKEVNDPKNKRKFIFNKKELGQQATWLADDIKRLMPKETKENWKGYQHSHLQQLLAFYEYQPEELRTYLKEYSLNNNEWIETSLKENTFHQFYALYLCKRKKYFENLETQIDGFKGNGKILYKFLDQHVWPIFHKRLYKISPTKTQTEQLLNKPLVFPRGIFDEKPTYIKGVHIKDNLHLYARWYTFIQDKNHKLQKFYLWERDYKELFEQHKHAAEFVNNEHCLSEDQKFDLFKKKWDKKIKKIIGQDLFLKLMMEKMIKDLYHQKVNLPLALSDFYRNKKEKGDKSKNIIKDDFIWSMEIPFKYKHKSTDEQNSDKYTIDEKIKLKDIGTFIRLLNDERIQRIFEYNADKKWKRSEIEDELKSYETKRIKIFKLLQNLEKTILEMYHFDGVHHPKCLEEENHPSFNKYINVGLLNKYPEIDEEKSEENKQTSSMLIYLRNKFAHNQLPTKEYYDDIIPKEIEDSKPTVAENILHYLERNIRTIENKIKAL